jgi:hypothetical protein
MRKGYKYVLAVALLLLFSVAAFSTEKRPVVDDSYPAEYAEAVTPSDTVNFTYMSRGLYVGTGGNIAVVMISGDTVTFTNVQDGSILPIKVMRVNSTNTTASNIVEIF